MPTTEKTTTTKTASTKKPTEEETIQKIEKKLNSYLTKIFGKTEDLDEIKQKATTLISDKKEKTKKNIQELNALVKKHPTASLIIAALAGAGVGALNTKIKAKKAVKKAKKK